MRDSVWLKAQLLGLLESAYADLPRPNPIQIVFGRAARGRFGSIRLVQGVSVITINGHFRNEAVPEQVVQATIAHELAHYAHGFSSLLPRKYAHPHEGGVIDLEFRKRGLHLLGAFERTWTRSHWRDFLRTQA